jgi:hypothetical protein
MDYSNCGLVGMPRFTLLSEALASASEIYFALVYFQLWDKDHPLVHRYLSTGYNVDKGPKKKFLKQFNEALPHPFLAYKACVKDILKITEFCFQLASTKREMGYGFAGNLKKLISNCKYWEFLSIFDLNYDIFIFYAIIHCGEISTAKDIACVNQVQKILNDASSMEEFLLDLGIQLPEYQKSTSRRSA